jgi:predicted lipid-binding transport protein (Tim44 family)
MMGEGFQFLDIILFAMIAAFLILRLRSILGRRQNPPGGSAKDPFRSGPSKSTSDDKVVQLPDQSGLRPDAEQADADDPLAAGLAEIARVSGGFDREEFLVGARTAFEMILNAFATGDTQFLKSLLSDEVYGNFLSAIRERDKEGETLENTLVGIRNAEMIEAYMEGSNAFVTVKIKSEQVNVTKNEAGQIVNGDPNHIQQVTDIWTFSRDTKSRDPNWALVATRSLD